jgi:hypothetical protein
MRNDRRSEPESKTRDVGSLQFASAKFLMRLTGGHCPMPNHPDKRPSFSAKPGRVPGTTVVACGAKCCTQRELLAHLSTLGYRLGPMKMAAKRQRRQVIATTSIAWRALTPSERRMYDQIHASDDGLTYNDFVLAGISRSAVSVGLRALQALGFLGVKRSPRRKGCQRYGQNLYWIERRWLDYEAHGLSQAIKAKALDTARTVARAARNGGEDISQPAPLDASRHRRKTETGGSDLRVSEVRVRGSDSGTESYVVRSLTSLSEHSDRLTLSMKRTSGGSGSNAAPPVRDASDPGPMSEDSYGYDPNTDRSVSSSSVPRATPKPSTPTPVISSGFKPCDMACRKGCVQPDGVCVKLKGEQWTHGEKSARRGDTPDNGKGTKWAKSSS